MFLWKVFVLAALMAASSRSEATSNLQESELDKKSAKQVLVRHKRGWLCGERCGGESVYETKPESTREFNERRQESHRETVCPTVCWNPWPTTWGTCTHQCGGAGLRWQTRTIKSVKDLGECKDYGNSTKCYGPSSRSQPCNRFCKNGGTPNSRGCSCPAGYRSTCCETTATTEVILNEVTETTAFEKKGLSTSATTELTHAGMTETTASEITLNEVTEFITSENNILQNSATTTEVILNEVTDTTAFEKKSLSASAATTEMILNEVTETTASELILNEVTENTAFENKGLSTSAISIIASVSVVCIIFCLATVVLVCKKAFTCREYYTTQSAEFQNCDPVSSSNGVIMHEPEDYLKPVSSHKIHASADQADPNTNKYSYAYEHRARRFLQASGNVAPLIKTQLYIPMDTTKDRSRNRLQACGNQTIQLSADPSDPDETQTHYCYLDESAVRPQSNLMQTTL